LAITRAEHNDADLCATASGLYVASDRAPEPPVLATPRINVTSAPLDLWRYIIPGNPFVSGPRSFNSNAGCAGCKVAQVKGKGKNKGQGNGG
jgi:3-methyladenine DNA glycosylase Mpg